MNKSRYFHGYVEMSAFYIAGLFYVIADLHLNIKYNKLQEREYFMDKNDTVSVSKDLCKSVFKSGKSTPSVSDFTQKWIELINNCEKKKTFSL